MLRYGFRFHGRQFHAAIHNRYTFSLSSLITEGIFLYAQTMEQNISVESFKDYDKNVMPFYVKEIVPHTVKRKLFKPIDKGRLGTSATHMGMGKINAKTSTGKFIVEFLNKATIHGLNHIAAPHRHFSERILAILFIGVGLVCTVIASLHYWGQYQYDATSMVVDINYENYNITKPAMTVCLNSKVSAALFPEVFKKFGVEDTQEARDFFLFISSPMYRTLNQTPLYNGTSPEKWLEILRDLYINVELNKCSGYNIQCDESDGRITDIVTENGMCTTVYGNYALYSSVDYWISNNWSVNPNNDLPVYTYVAFHHPNEVPESDDTWWDHSEPSQLDVLISIQEVESSDDLRKLSEHQRPCRYPEDGGMEMWPVYTRNMCLLQLKYNFFKTECGCYPHFARPMPGIQICNATQLHCIGKLQDRIASFKQEKISSGTCPDSCYTTRYSRIHAEGTGINFIGDLSEEERNRVMNIEAQFPFHKLRNEVFFGFNEFLVAVGGAAGLFLGASIISFVEIIYYLTLRLFWYIIYIHRKGK